MLQKGEHSMHVWEVTVDSLTIETQGFRYMVRISCLYYDGVLVKRGITVEETIIMGYSP